MKLLSILAAASLALTPAMVSADQHKAGGGTPKAGGLAGRVIPESEVPVGAIVVAGLVIVGGVVIGILAGGDSNNTTNPPVN